MKQVHILSLILIIIFLLQPYPACFIHSKQQYQQKDPVYVGVAFGGNTTAQAKLLIDRTKSYTNLFILDSGINPISTNELSVEKSAITP